MFFPVPKCSSKRLVKDLLKDFATSRRTFKNLKGLESFGKARFGDRKDNCVFFWVSHVKAFRGLFTFFSKPFRSLFKGLLEAFQGL
jgi:hypothetical protein